MKLQAQMLYNYIESKNSHGKNQLKQYMEKIGLENTRLYNSLTQSSYGKNQLKDLWLKSFIDGLTN